jgi:hypothetical protein
LDNPENGLVAELKGPSIPKLFACRIAMENVLFHAAPKPLRGAILFHVGTMNNHRQKPEGFILTRNPLITDHPLESGTGTGGTGGTGTGTGTVNTNNGLHFLTLLKAGDTPKIADAVISYEQAQRWLPALMDDFPQVYVDVIRKDPAFPRVFPHIVLSGADLHEVGECRKMMEEWMQYEASANHSSSFYHH